MVQQLDFAHIGDAALSAHRSIFEHWLPGGRFSGKWYSAKNPTRSDRREGSFKVNVQTGRWKDYATGDSGSDLIALVAYIENIKQGEAARKIAGLTGLNLNGQDGHDGHDNGVKPHGQRLPSNRQTLAQTNSDGRDGQELSIVGSIPIDQLESMPRNHWKHGVAIATWIYRNRDGSASFVVCRFEGKEFAPLTLWRDANGAYKWQFRGSKTPRILYNADRIESNKTAPVLLCEGEKAADAAAELLPDWVVTASAHGAQSAGQSDWSMLADRDVLIWPDFDQPGAKYAKDAQKLLRTAAAKTAEIIDLEKLRVFCDRELQYQLSASDDAADLTEAGMTSEMLRSFLSTCKPEAPKQPSRFQLRDDGVYYTGDEQDLFLCAPLHLEAITCDERHENFGRLLSFKDMLGNRHEWCMPMEMLSGNGDEYRKALLNMGLSISPSKKAQSRLSEYIQTHSVSRQALCSNRTGWHHNSFVLPSHTYRANGDPEIIYQSADVFHYGLSSKGTLAEWKQNVSALAAGNSRLLFALSVALAAPLLHLLSEESGGFHFRGDSSVGKTTAAVAACSVYGPRDYMLQWRATDNGLESVAATHSDMLLALDEIGQMDPVKVGEVAYMIANGKGKTRANRHGAARPQYTWRLLFLSTGEYGLNEAAQRAGKKVMAGQEVRIVDIPADAGAGCGIFEVLHGYPDGKELAVAFANACANYYGTAGPEFVKLLVQDVDTARAMAKDYAEQFLSGLDIDANHGQAMRVMARFAVCAAAGELATAYGVTGWNKGEATKASQMCCRAWFEAKGAGQSFEQQEMLRQVRLFFEQHGDSRFAEIKLDSDGGYADAESRTVVNRAGFKKRTDSGIEYFVLPEVFKSEICKGIDSRATTKLLQSAGWLLADKHDGKAQARQHLPNIGTKRVYHFAPTVLADETSA